MAPDRHKNLALILTRELASNLATPLFIVDPDGTLVFYNEPAETVLGKRYAEAGPLTIEEWGGVMFEPRDANGHPLKTEELPLAITLEHHKPSHKQLWITGLDGVERSIEVTAFPIFAKADEFVGAVAIFWEDQ